MRRRDLIAGLGAGATTGLAGCLGVLGGGGDGGGFETRNARVPPVVADRPDAVYHPTHFESMNMVGTATDGAQRLALTYTFPHRFWTMQAARGTQKVELTGENSVHLMASVWYPDHGVFVTDASPSVTLEGPDGTVENNPWAMLSQPMGYHFGDNVALPGEGTYTVTVETSAPTNRRTGGLAGVGGRGSFEYEFDWSPSKLQDLRTERYPDKKGSSAALAPMDMPFVPLGRAPDPESMPGRTLGTGESGDATFVVALLDGREGVDGEDPYLVVSPRTPYNGFVIPQMTLRAVVNGDESTATPLTAALDPELNHHYGASVPVESGDTVRIDVQAPPQVARHEGYETAFLEMGAVEVTA